MANPIKYTTATQSNSIKAGNFAVGVNKGGYGPTNVTYFYNGKTPNVGGYTVYVANGTASPSVFVAGNDTNLITLSNQLGGSGITTIAAALNFFNSSSTILCTNIDYPNIVTSGLVLNLDAAYTPSYPKNGTTWKDLSGNGNNGTLTNGPTYSSTDGGSLVFDGTSSYVRVDSTILQDSGGTINVWCKPTALPVVTGYIVSTVGTNSDRFYISHYLDGNFTMGRGNPFVGFSPGIKPLNVWYNLTMTWTSTSVSAYFNGVQVGVTTSYTASGTTSNFAIGGYSSPFGSQLFTGNISNVQIYNRALSSTEVLQNYYAGFQRLIPTNGLVMSLDAENTDKRVSLPSVAYDMSVNKNNGTMLNSISLSTIGRTSFVLDGVNYQISTPYSSTFDFSLAQTIILWLKPGTGATASRRNPYSQAYGGSGTITQETYGNFTYYFGTAGTDNTPYTGISSLFTVATNELAFIAVTRDQVTNTVNWYKNGSFVTSSNAGGYTTTNNGSLPIKIGTGYAGYFVGNIGQTFVYNRALTTTEISTIYNATRSRYGL
jgi:hypothetical protein